MVCYATPSRGPENDVINRKLNDVFRRIDEAFSSTNGAEMKNLNDGMIYDLTSKELLFKGYFDFIDTCINMARNCGVTKIYFDDGSEIRINLQSEEITFLTCENVTITVEIDNYKNLKNYSPYRNVLLPFFEKIKNFKKD